MVRFILNLGPRDHVDQQQRFTLNYLRVENRVKFLKFCHVNKICNNTCAKYMHEHFCKVSNVHRYNTRGSANNNYQVPKIKSHADSSFYFSTIKEWNHLPKHLKHASNIAGFKSAIHGYLSNN